MKKHYILCAVAVLYLSACQSVKRELGVGRNSPDEFTVVKRAPLTLPPDYDLRPPTDGSLAAPASQSSNEAKTVLLGKSTEVVTKGSADDSLLQKMGTGAADASIRNKIEEENGYIALENQSVADKLIFWKSEDNLDDKVPTSEVDPKKEADRLKKAKEDGAPVNAGDVPVIIKKQSTIEKLF